jgi:ABC-2 type transport system permease protein
MRKIIHEIKIGYLFIVINIRAEMQNRVAFITQIIGMLVNDGALVFVWIMFFQVTGTMNGWSSLDMIGLQSLHMLTYGIVMSFFYGTTTLPDQISNGIFDNLLTSPTSLYMRVITSASSTSAVGDILFGFTGVIIYLVLTGATIFQILILIAVFPAMCLLFLSMLMLFGLIGMYLPDAGDISKNMRDVFITPGIFPYNLFEGGIKFFFLVIFPALMLSGYPIEILKNNSLSGILVIWVMAIFWTIVATKLLNNLVKRYESGNLVGARV